MNLQKLRFRTLIIIVLIVSILSGFTFHLFAHQIIRGEYYAMRDAFTVGIVPIPAARGVILDRNGIPLVYNETTTSLVFEHPFFPAFRTDQTRRNELLERLISLFELHQAEWLDMLPIQLQNGRPVFIEDREDDIAAMKVQDFLDLNEWATAENVMDALIDRFDLHDFDLATARDIASVQYNMWRMDYRLGVPYTFAGDVTPELISYVRENSLFFAGVHTQLVPVRQYKSGTLAPHILGRVANINPADFERHRDSDEPYRLIDDYGVSGIERAAQPYLRGREGQKTITVDRSTGLATEYIDQPPMQGNTVTLTIDSALQAYIEEVFPRSMHGMNHSLRRDTRVPVAGSIVVLCVRTFEVLAAVNYPSFDNTLYQEYHVEWASDPRAPLFNRALQGTYEPGSTAKLSVSLAALQENIISPAWSFHCTGAFHFLGMSFACPQVGLHGGRPVNVSRAFVDSCNSFYYEMGRRLGYSRINEFRLATGLGQRTGVELPEAVGVMDSPEFRATRGQNFYAGNNLLTAIGQGNLFTPMQLAVHTATVANMGTRLNANFIQSVRHAGTNEIVHANTPTVLNQSGISAEHYRLMHDAMMQVGTRPGSLSGRYFANLPVRVAGKTGTSEVYREIDGRWQASTNGIYISFAPYENPEIAVIGIGEGGTHSGIVIPTIANIYAFYFRGLDQMTRPQRENVLL